jgi:glycosyltransferase involved in cell wall biosynthesis
LNGELRLLFIGRLHPIKGLENLFDAISELPNSRLLICGDGDQRYVKALRELVQTRGLTNRITFRGWVNEDAKCQAFQQSDMFVLPSFSENFGMVVAESLAHGVPVVVSNQTPWGEIEAKGCGRFVANDADSLRSAIDELGHRDLATAGEKGRQWMRESFSWTKIASDMVELYRSLL